MQENLITDNNFAARKEILIKKSKIRTEFIVLNAFESDYIEVISEYRVNFRMTYKLSIILTKLEENQSN